MIPPVVENPLFFLDYDGTLAPIVDDPMQAFPHPEIPDLLDELAERYPVWIVTGRYLKDLEVLMDRSHDAIGLHGIQRGRLGDGTQHVMPDDARQAIEALRATVPELEGVRVEEKGPMFAVHYRLAENKAGARAALREWLLDLPSSLDPIWGKDVVELRPRGVSKGTAVREIADRYEHRTPLYLGDDVTDEDAFRELSRNAVTVKVGEGDTVARFRLRSVEEVVAYLRRYLE